MLYDFSIGSVTTGYARHVKSPAQLSTAHEVLLTTSAGVDAKLVDACSQLSTAMLTSG